MNPLRILLADDHEIVRRGLISLLKSHAGMGGMRRSPGRTSGR